VAKKGAPSPGGFAPTPGRRALGLGNLYPVPRNSSFSQKLNLPMTPERFTALCAKIRNGSATYVEWLEAWNWAWDEEDRSDWSDRGHLIDRVGKWRGDPVDDLEHAAAISEFC
jgi:hypothetical protein